MPLNDIPSATLAELLLKIKAVKLSPHAPFQWASGMLSPIYCDNRITLSYPSIRTYICQLFIETIRKHFLPPDMIAGVATGGIAHGVLVAQEMELPFLYVRPEPKHHGLKKQIEGDIPPHVKTIVVIEDLVSTGKSSLQAIQALQETNATIAGLVSVFSYQLPQAIRSFQENHIPFYSLTDFPTLINVARHNHYIREEDIQLLLQWKENPEKWHHK